MNAPVLQRPFLAAYEGPVVEPDRSVWRLLSNARAQGVALSDAQLTAALPFSTAQLAAARARVEGHLYPLSTEITISSPEDIEALRAEPNVSLDECLAAGLI